MSIYFLFRIKLELEYSSWVILFLINISIIATIFLTALGCRIYRSYSFHGLGSHSLEDKFNCNSILGLDSLYLLHNPTGYSYFHITPYFMIKGGGGCYIMQTGDCMRYWQTI